ncbi:MAG: CDP-diacylglycerol--serine O-phosphatidyltransferase [Myxococcota bacterium]
MNELDRGPGDHRRRSRRNRGDGSERSRGLLLLPHILTTLGLGFGFFAIVKSFAGQHDLAAGAIIFAMLCDVFDGRVARLARSTSRFGGEYDSIADTVSFGVAPAMLAVSAGNLQILGRAGWIMAFLYTACAALRLARFNVAPSRYRGRFEGLPSPAAAGMIASTQLFVTFVRELGVAVDVPEALIAGATALLGLLMVSSIPYRSFKEIDLRHSFITLVFVVFAASLIVLEPAVSLFTLGLLYTVHGPIEWLWRLRSGRVLEEAAPDGSTDPPARMTP